jgi:hypothetical protein
MARLLLALTAALVLAAPAGARTRPLDLTPVAAPACHRTAAQPRVIATRTNTRKGHATIVACDRASGRRTTLRRGFIGYPPRHAPALGPPVVQGTRVIWSELDGAVRHLQQELRSADGRRPGRQQRRRVGPVSARPSDVEPDFLKVVALPHGLLAYIAYRTRFALVLARPGHAPETLSRAIDIDEPIHVEDDRTLVWSEASGYTARDFAPVRHDASGCPIRSRFRDVLVDTPALRVVEATYGSDPIFSDSALRICWKAGRQDPIVSTLFTETFFDGPILAQGPYVAMAIGTDDRYQGCGLGDAVPVSVSVIDARTGRRLPAIFYDDCVVLDALVLAPDGATAALVTGNGTQRVEVAGAPPDGHTVLDSGPAGSLAGLAATPDGGFTWTHDGAPRAAAAPTP